jgi:4-aminobutyrate aminotransferase/(S)-3-amino-2-methylpropionate transaminase
MTRAIHLQTEIPGPRSRDIVARRDAAMPSGAARLTPIAIASAHGAVVTDVDGNRYLDFAGGIGTLALGHTPTAVVEAVQQQAGQMLHMCAIVASYEPLVAVAERLNELVAGRCPAADAADEQRRRGGRAGGAHLSQLHEAAGASWCSMGPTTGAPT